MGVTSAPSNPFPAVVELIVAILTIVGYQGSLVGMVRFAKRHCMTLTGLLDTLVAKPPTVSTFQLRLADLVVEGFQTPVDQ